MINIFCSFGRFWAGHIKAVQISVTFSGKGLYYSKLHNTKLVNWLRAWVTFWPPHIFLQYHFDNTPPTLVFAIPFLNLSYWWGQNIPPIPWGFHICNGNCNVILCQIYFQILPHQTVWSLLSVRKGVVWRLNGWNPSAPRQATYNIMTSCIVLVGTALVGPNFHLKLKM